MKTSQSCSGRLLHLRARICCDFCQIARMNVHVCVRACLHVQKLACLCTFEQTQMCVFVSQRELKFLQLLSERQLVTLEM